MQSKTALVALSVVVIGGVWAASASAQQLSPIGQRLLSSITPQEIAAACAKGSDGISALVRDKAQGFDRSEKAQAGAQSPLVGKTIGAQCPAK
jgi:hypothetical protein